MKRLVFIVFAATIIIIATTQLFRGNMAITPQDVYKADFESNITDWKIFAMDSVGLKVSYPDYKFRLEEPKGDIPNPFSVEVEELNKGDMMNSYAKDILFYGEIHPLDIYMIVYKKNKDFIGLKEYALGLMELDRQNFEIETKPKMEGGDYEIGDLKGYSIYTKDAGGYIVNRKFFIEGGDNILEIDYAELGKSDPSPDDLMLYTVKQLILKRIAFNVSRLPK